MEQDRRSQRLILQSIRETEKASRAVICKGEIVMESSSSLESLHYESNSCSPSEFCGLGKHP